MNNIYNDKLYKSIKNAKNLLNVYYDDNNIIKDQYIVDKIIEEMSLKLLFLQDTADLSSQLADEIYKQFQLDINKIKKIIENRYDININTQKIDFDRLYQVLLKHNCRDENLRDIVDNSSCFTLYNSQNNTYSVFLRKGYDIINQRFNAFCALSDIVLAENENAHINTLIKNHFEALKSFNILSNDDNNCTIAYALTIMIDSCWLKYERYVENILITKDMLKKKNEIDAFYNIYKKPQLLSKQKK